MRSHVGLFFILLLVEPFLARAAEAPPQPDLEDSVKLMAKIGSCTTPRFSPDGQRLAFLSNLSGSPQVWIVPSEGGWPTQVTAFDDPVTGVVWSPDGLWLALSVAPGGGLNTQIYLMHPDGTGLRRITDGGKENNGLGRFEVDGRLLSLTSNRKDPAATDAYLYDMQTGELRFTAHNPGIGSLTDVSEDGARAVLFRLRSRGDDNLYSLDLKASTETLLTEHQPPGSFGGGLLSPDGSTVYLASNKDRDLAAFARIRLGDGGRPGPIELLQARDDAELDNLEVTEDGTAAALLWNKGGRSELVFVDLDTLKSTAGPELPAEIVSAMQFTRDGRRLAMTVSGARTPSDLWVLDRPSGRLWQVTHSPHAGVDLNALVRPELITYRAQDGLELSGWLYRPRQANAPGPMVLSFHGGPEGQERPSFSSTYQALVSQGISVFAPNVRGSSGFGKKFVNLDNGALRVGAVRDIKASVDAVVEKGFAQPGHIGIMGGSYGGYMTMAGLTEYPELFAAGADLFGVVNFETFFKNSEPWMAAISTIEYGDPATEAEMLKSLSPLHKVDRVRAPTLVLHGANDTNVPVIEAEQIVDSLKKRGTPVEYILFPDEGHGWRKMPNRIRSTVAVVGWFRKYLAQDGPGSGQP